METYSSLTKNQKEATFLLAIGTFLEYFDFMLYVHMAVLLNTLFFPKTDPHTAALLQAFSFCIAFIFRPLGALIFGWIGDNVSRKSTVIITTIMMAISCAIMANLPTYTQIGITAAWLVTICRIVQGMSSMGEIVGAELYLTELTKPPVQYPIVGFIVVASSIGGLAALGIASFVTSNGFNWRLAFWIGAGIALVGSVARTALRETPEFADAKCILKRRHEKANIDPKIHKRDLIINDMVNKYTAIFSFILNCEWPLCFYFIYIYCSDILKTSFGYSAEAIIQHNFLIQFFIVINELLITLLSYKIYPLKIIKVRVLTLLVFILFCPFLLNRITMPFHLFLIQLFVALFAGSRLPAVPIFFKHFPVFKRFTYGMFIYALSRALMYVIVSFGMVYLTKYLKYYGFLVIMVPICIGCYLAIEHFSCLEKIAGNYPQKSNRD